MLSALKHVPQRVWLQHIYLICELFFHYVVQSKREKPAEQCKELMWRLVVVHTNAVFWGIAQVARWAFAAQGTCSLLVLTRKDINGSNCRRWCGTSDSSVTSITGHYKTKSVKELGHNVDESFETKNCGWLSGIFTFSEQRKTAYIIRAEKGFTEHLCESPTYYRPQQQCWTWYWHCLN